MAVLPDRLVVLPLMVTEVLGNLGQRAGRQLGRPDLLHVSSRIFSIQSTGVLTQRSLDPVSKSSINVWAGVPICTGHRYSLSSWISSAVIWAELPLASRFAITCVICVRPPTANGCILELGVLDEDTERAGSSPELGATVHEHVQSGSWSL
jgi:hypothetical protein